MSVIETTAYGAKCDRCQKLFEDEFTGYSLWCEKDRLLEEMYDSGWVDYSGKYYCPNCYKINKETDEIIIKK
jgi:hypothetical protein